VLEKTLDKAERLFAMPIRNWKASSFQKKTEVEARQNEKKIVTH
jgi:hypothetical protein